MQLQILRQFDRQLPKLILYDQHSCNVYSTNKVFKKSELNSTTAKNILQLSNLTLKFSMKDYLDSY